MGGVVGGIVGGAAQIFGAARQSDQQAEAREAQEAIARISNQQRELIAARERTQAVRQARQARADLLVTGETLGARASSPLSGSVSGISSQLSGNLAFSEQQQELERQKLELSAQAATAQTEAARTGNVVSGITGAIGAVSSVFGI